MTFYKNKSILVSGTGEEIEKTLQKLSAYPSLREISEDSFSIRVASGIPSLFRVSMCSTFRGSIKQNDETNFEISYEIRPPAITSLFLAVCLAAFIAALVYLIKNGMSATWPYFVLCLALWGLLTVAESVSQAKSAERRFWRAFNIEPRY